VVATELCTDAVSATGAGLVTLRAWEDDLALVVEVEGGDGGFDVPVRDSRGLLIVEGLCDEVLTAVRGRNRLVRCRKRLGVSP
jgi:hypothetical protein